MTAVQIKGTMEVITLPLREFLECFHPPQVGKIVSGLPDDILFQEDLNITEGTGLTFHRKINPNVSITFQDPWRKDSPEYIKLTLPVEFPGKFQILPYEPSSGDISEDHIFSSVEELTEVFPDFVQANVSYGDKLKNPAQCFKCGDRFKLIRLMYRDGEKVLECRPLNGSRLVSLPMNCIGNFTVVPTNNEYLLADIVSLIPRKRRVKLINTSSSRQVKIPGLPANFQGDLFVEEPDYFVEASPLHDPHLIIGLPHDLEMTVSADLAEVERGFLLNSFATNNRNIFPVVARVSDWDEETTILENHFIKPGVELIIHGWTRQSKVLARCGNRYFAIPLTYQGRFKLKPQEYKGVADLEHAHPAYKLKVVDVDLRESNFPLTRGDIIKVKRGDSMKKPKEGEVKYVKCEKYNLTGTSRSKEVKLPLDANVTFEEINETTTSHEQSIKELVAFISDHEINVELTRPSADQRVNERDLPVNEQITLCEYIIEPAVYVSVEAVDAPAFHVPLRTQCYVSFVEQLEKSVSPLLTKQSPKLSTLDRCVEVLQEDIFHQLNRYKAESNSFPSFSSAQIFGGPGSSQWNGSKVPQLQKIQSKVEVHRKHSFTETDNSFNQSRASTEQDAFLNRRYKSTENIFHGRTEPSMSLAQAHTDDFTVTLSSSEKNVTETKTLSKPEDGLARVYSTGAYNFSQTAPSPPATTLPQQQPQQQQQVVQQIHSNYSTSQTAIDPGSPMGTLERSRSGPHSPGINETMQAPPGYVLMPTAQAQAIPLGYSLVPVYQPSVAGSVRGPASVLGYSPSLADEEDDIDDMASDISKFTFSKAPSFKVTIPPDGNLYHYSVKKFADLLRVLKIEEPYIRICLKDKIDGKKFSRLTERDLDNYGLIHPIMLHFRRNTSKKKASSKFQL